MHGLDRAETASLVVFVFEGRFRGGGGDLAAPVIVTEGGFFIAPIVDERELAEPVVGLRDALHAIFTAGLEAGLRIVGPDLGIPERVGLACEVPRGVIPEIDAVPVAIDLCDAPAEGIVFIPGDGTVG